ncbi:MAG: periplasmic heavy metal sensor [Acidobacteriia bacterium]|nr:periplasmic heavy metal sensor [Terriglobia bacterium]
MYRLLLTLIIPLLAHAQPPRNFFPWWETPLVRDLNLSEDQQKQIRKMQRDARSAMIDMRYAQEKAEVELEDLFNEDTVDSRKTNDAIEKLVRARSDMTRAFAQLSLKLRAVLTPQQWQELQKRRPQPGQMGPGRQGPQGSPQGPPNGPRPGRGPGKGPAGPPPDA